jgi:hypothetical protein
MKAFFEMPQPAQVIFLVGVGAAINDVILENTSSVVMPVVSRILFTVFIFLPPTVKNHPPWPIIALSACAKALFVPRVVI